MRPYEANPFTKPDAPSRLSRCVPHEPPVSCPSANRGVASNGRLSKSIDPANDAVPNALEPTPRCTRTECIEFMKSGTLEK